MTFYMEEITLFSVSRRSLMNFVTQINLFASAPMLSDFHRLTHKAFLCRMVRKSESRPGTGEDIWADGSLAQS